MSTDQIADPQLRSEDLEEPVLRRTLALFSAHKPKLAAFLALTVLTAVLSLVPVFLIKSIVDLITPAADGSVGSTRALLFLITLAVVSYTASGLLEVARAYVSQAIGQSVVFDLRRRVYEHLLRQSVRFHVESSTGSVISRITSDINQVEQFLIGTFAQFFRATMMMAVALPLMVLLDWRLALVSVALLLLWVYPTQRVGRAQRVLSREFQAETAEMSSHLAETMSVPGAMVVRSFGREEHEAERFARSNRQMRAVSIKRQLQARWIVAASELFGYMAVLAVFTIGGIAVIRDATDLGTVVAMSVLMQRVLGPFALITRVTTQVFASMAMFERIFEYLDLPIEIEEAAEPRQVAGRDVSVDFEHVTFKYPGTDELVLDDVSFQVPAGGMAALVGPSGAGKTTVTYLLQRFYDPTEGRITLDGIDLRDASLASVADTVGAVLQDSFLFHDTLKENIRYGGLDATDEEIAEAARTAGLTSVMEELPDGLETVVGARGYRLSGGQKQRVAIARAVLKNPPVLILDEATASLDSRLEREIQEATARLAVGRTTLVVAHRLSTIQAADVILVFDHGRIVQQGTHEDLLASGGLYATLYHEQFAQEAPVGAVGTES